MADREKVIKGLECCSDTEYDCVLQNDCPYSSNYGEGCMLEMKKDALELLKAQEPVAPYMDYDGQDVWRCGSCGATLFHLSHTQADESA